VRELVVGTRGSALALAQTAIVCDALRRLVPGLSIRVEAITTRGDARTDVPLQTLGRGVFVSEIEGALRERRIDFAVHSAKDLPSGMEEALTVAAFLPRSDARDVLVSRVGPLSEMPVGARVGTSSPRRVCQLRALRPDLALCDLRGNVDTRLRKLAAGEYDAIVLAAAGLIRLGREGEVTDWLDPETIIPCVGQGALAVQARADDEVVGLLAGLDDVETRAAVLAERAFLAELGAGCLAAAAAHARVTGTRVRLRAMIGDVTGSYQTLTREGDVRDATYLGSSVARALLRTGAAKFLGGAGALAGVRVALTRAPDQVGELMALLSARGAHPISCPTIAIQPSREMARLDARLRMLATVDWLVFTSANAVRAVADRLIALKIEILPETKVAAVGGATAEAVASYLRSPDFVAPDSSAHSLADLLPDVAGRDVLFPCGDLALGTIAERLRRRGARMQTAVAYHTVRGVGVRELESRVVAGSVDAVVFASR
jgi:hydroxymethylbilane synthase